MTQKEIDAAVRNNPTLAENFGDGTWVCYVCGFRQQKPCASFEMIEAQIQNHLKTHGVKALAFRRENDDGSFTNGVTV